MTPGLALGIGAFSGLILAARLANAWCAAQRRFRRPVLAVAVGVLAAPLGKLQRGVPAFGPDGDEVQRCVDLCVALQRLVEN